MSGVFMDLTSHTMPVPWLEQRTRVQLLQAMVDQAADQDFLKCPGILTLCTCSRAYFISHLFYFLTFNANFKLQFNTTQSYSKKTKGVTTFN